MSDPDPDALRARLAGSFDEAAEGYHRARPRCPEPVLDALVAGLPAAARVLEVGCGTGQATRGLAERGLAVTALEPGPALAALARRALADLRAVRIVEDPFETHRSDDPFDAVVAVQAMHWFEPGRALDLAAARLSGGGRLALAWHQDAGHAEGDAFHGATDPVYARFFADLRKPSPETAPDRFELAIAGHPGFGPVRRTEHDWEVVHDRDGYLELLATFSDTLSLAEPDRQAFLDAIGVVVEARGGRVVKRYRSVVLAAETDPGP